MSDAMTFRNVEILRRVETSLATSGTENGLAFGCLGKSSARVTGKPASSVPIPTSTKGSGSERPSVPSSLTGKTFCVGSLRSIELGRPFTSGIASGGVPLDATAPNIRRKTSSLGKGYTDIGTREILARTVGRFKSGCPLLSPSGTPSLVNS